MFDALLSFIRVRLLWLAYGFKDENSMMALGAKEMLGCEGGKTDHGR